MVAGRRMVDRLGDAAAIDAELVSDAGELLEVLAQLQAGLARVAEAERALNIEPPAAGHLRGELVLAAEFFEMQIGQLRFRVEGIDVAGAAFHEQEDTGPGFRRMMTRLWRERTRRLCFGADERVERHSPECRPEAVEKIT